MNTNTNKGYRVDYKANNVTLTKGFVKKAGMAKGMAG